MIESIGIKNYKSIVDLQFDVGRVNILMGENGSGKSNILEAIALAAAAEADKLDNEFLSSRGIRLTSPSLMRSSFNQAIDKSIDISIKSYNQEYTYHLENDNKPYSEWIYKPDLDTPVSMLEELERLKQHIEYARKKVTIKANQFQSFQEFIEDYKKMIERIKNLKEDIIEENSSFRLDVESVRRNYISSIISNIIVYSPEETALRNLYREGQIEPLGIHGEGLLKLIKVLIEDSSSTPMETIKESLAALGWFEDIDISSPEVSFAEEERISIFDRFTKSWFDQRSANEGFLFVLFYTALMISKDTPPIFAIDNVDASLNPKLCTKVVSDMVRLAKQFDKQCFLTAHNPAVLDGIDLGDDEQRLFVVSRNRKGHTRIKRIMLEDKPVSSTGEDLKLSEAFLRGYLGGLPKNF